MTESRPSYRGLVKAMSHVADALVTQHRPTSGMVVLVPFAQLLPLARAAWGQAARSGFAPRFETTHSWAARLAPFAPQGLDIAFDPARDLVVAQQLMQSARLGPAVPATALVAAATELARRASAVPPDERTAWLEASRAVLPLVPDAPHAVEAALARLALEWVGSSRYATDVLWRAMQSDTVDHLFVLRGLQDDPLVQAWCQHWPDRCTTIHLTVPADVPLPSLGSHAGGLRLHEAADAEDEAQRAAACVLRHLEAGRVPVALATTDRVTSRRVQALLSERGVPVRDETGWRLSTTRAAATVMRCIELWAPDPSTDSILDGLQQMVALSASRIAEPAVLALEAFARRHSAARWQPLAQRVLASAQAPVVLSGASVSSSVHALVQLIEDGRLRGQGRRPLGAWLTLLREWLQDIAVWDTLTDDPAGEQVASALGLLTADDTIPLADLQDVPAVSRAVPWSAWVSWTRAVLEGASFRPPVLQGASAQVVLLPLAQFVGRDFAAAVLPGCDESNLPQAPLPGGPFTRGQRDALGLATAVEMRQAQDQAWRDALSTPAVDVLWRRKDALGNPVSPSGLVERLQIERASSGSAVSGGPGAAADPRPVQALQPRLRDAAAAVAPLHVPAELSASAYADLRACPYRFFGLRMLGLREDDEIETRLDKRDFGSWLHRVLHGFHERLKQYDTASAAAPTLQQQREWLNAEADRARSELALSEAEFLPFVAAWPDLRDRYLAWWAGQQANGVRYAQGEVEYQRALPRTHGSVLLKGRIDRIDRVGHITRVIDYKTEHDSRTRQRVKDPYEDTQMAFYAALVTGAQTGAATNANAREDGSALEGGYLQLGERTEPRWFEQKSLSAARDALLVGIARDLDAVAAGAPLRAIGSGDACAYCAARGLCRKEHWR